MLLNFADMLSKRAPIPAIIDQRRIEAPMVWISRLSKGRPESWIDGPASPEPCARQGAADSAPAVSLHIAITSRQLECLAWVAEGKSAIEIGMILSISDRTVEKHIARACEIFGVNRRIQAVDCARRLGLFATE